MLFDESIVDTALPVSLASVDFVVPSDWYNKNCILFATNGGVVKVLLSGEGSAGVESILAISSGGHLKVKPVKIFKIGTTATGIQLHR